MAALGRSLDQAEAMIAAVPSMHRERAGLPSEKIPGMLQFRAYSLHREYS